MEERIYCFDAPRDGAVYLQPDAKFEAGCSAGFVQSCGQDGQPLAALIANADGVTTGKADVPLHFEIPAEPGFYDVTVEAKCSAADMELTVLSTHRRFQAVKVPVRRNEKYELEFSVRVCDVQPNELPLVPGDRIRVTLLGENAVLSAVRVRPSKGVTIFVAGDSTVTDQDAAEPYDPMTSYCGWGQCLSLYFGRGAAVSNHAQSGLTTDTFRNDAHWEPALSAMQPGDFCLFQFAHNDQKCDELAAFGRYLGNLRRFAEECRAHGVTPIFCSPINRILFEENGALRDLLSEYGDAAKVAAEDEGVPFIDLLGQTTAIFTDAGPDKAPNYFHNDGTNVDRTHTNDYGGQLIASLVAGEFKRQGVEPLCGLIRPDFVPTPIPPLVIKPVRAGGVSTSFMLNGTIKINTATVTDISDCPERAQILELVARGILCPAHDDCFEPDEPMTVADAAKAMLASLGEPDADAPFDRAKEKGILPFDAERDAAVTREQLCAMLVSTYNLRAPDKAIIGKVDHYRDADQISPWALDHVRAADEMKFAFPGEDGMFRPGETISRANAAAWIRKMAATR